MAIETDDPNKDVSIDMNGLDGNTNNDKTAQQQARKRKKVPFYKMARNDILGGLKRHSFHIPSIIHSFFFAKCMLKKEICKVIAALSKLRNKSCL